MKTQKTAIIYCRAATKEEAKRQQAEAEKMAKKLNAVVKAVFIDIIPLRKQTIWRRLVRFFRKNKPLRASKRADWRKAIAYLKEHKTDYTMASGGTKVSPGSTVSLTGNTTLYAHWTASTVPADNNPGSNASSSPTGSDENKNNPFFDGQGKGQPFVKTGVGIDRKFIALMVVILLDVAFMVWLVRRKRWPRRMRPTMALQLPELE